MEGRYMEESHGMGKEYGRAGKTESREERIRAEEKEEAVQDKRNELVRRELDYCEWDDAEAVGKLFGNYGRNLKEYLVDGTVLTCSRATTEVMKSENYGWMRKENYGKMTAEEFRISDHEIGELALAFEGCYERSSHGREERTRNAYIWGIYFGVIDDATAEDEFRRRFGKALEADSWWSEQ